MDISKQIEIEIEYKNIIENIGNREYKIVNIDSNLLQFSTLFDQLKSTHYNISKVDLGKCEDKIRE